MDIPELSPPRHPLAVLPEEVWAAVFKRVDNFSDLWNLYHAHPLWRHILTTDKCLWQFPLVFGSLFKYLPANDILISRLVSKYWKNTVDCYLEVDQFNLHNCVSRHFNRVKTVELRFQQNSDNEEVQRFRNEMRNCRHNPIISRSVHLEIETGVPEALEFMEQFGHQIWHLRVSVRCSDNARSAEFVTFLCKLFNSVPNLRSLCFRFSHFVRLSDFVEEEKNLKELFRRQLPPLVHLKSLGLGCSEYTRDPYKIFIYEQLHFAFGSPLQQLYYRLNSPFQNTFENLTQLSFRIHLTSQLTQLQQLTSKLKVLDLWIDVDGAVPVASLFEAAQYFGSTLEFLSFRQFGAFTVITWASLDTVRLNLPVLKQLGWKDVDGFAMTFDFLERLSSLVRLDVQFTSYHQDNCGMEEERVKIRRYLDASGRPMEPDIYKSNVWKLLPKIEKLVFWSSISDNDNDKVPTILSRRQYDFLCKYREV